MNKEFLGNSYSIIYTIKVGFCTRDVLKRKRKRKKRNRVH